MPDKRLLISPSDEVHTVSIATPAIVVSDSNFAQTPKQEWSISPLVAEAF
jgi:hypothetical protein